NLATLDGTRAFSAQGRIGQDGNIQVGNNDIDLFKVVTVSPGFLNLQTDPVSSGAGFDSYLRLFNSAGTELAANDDIAATNLYSRLTSPTILPAGTYYVG